jgi:hypothetical protein
MEFDEAKIDDAVLALLYLSLRSDHRSWKSLDWEAMNRLHERGLISTPVSKAKSVVLTEEGEAQAQRLAEKLFGKD